MANIGQMRMQAQRSLRENRIDDSIADHRRLLAATPQDTESWYNLGYLLRCARHYDEALDAYDEAVRRGIDRPEAVYLNKAVILSEGRQRADEARQQLETALTIAPDFVPAWLNLANLHEDEGDPVAARACYARVLGIDPRNGRAIARTAVIETFEGGAEQLLPRLTAILSDAGLHPSERAEIAFALGGALDAVQRYDEAFATYTLANEAAWRAAPAQARYDPAAQERLVDALIALPPSPAGLDSGGEALVFICGMFRSGSTLLEQILSRHDRVTGGGELEIVPAMARHIAPYPQGLSALPRAALHRMQQNYLRELEQLIPGHDRVTDKRPDNFLHLGLIRRILPDARILHTTRDALDNILSIYFLYFDDSVAYGHRLTDIAHWYGQYRRLMDHWQGIYPDAIHDVSYDRLVDAPEDTIAAALASAGLPPQQDILDRRNSGGMVRTASAWQVRQPLHRKSSGRWRHYDRHLGAVRDILQL